MSVHSESGKKARRVYKDLSLKELAIEIVKDDPDSGDGRLQKRWAAQVLGDTELNALCVEEASAFALRHARRYWEQQKTKAAKAKKENDPKAEDRRKKLLKAAGKLCATVFDLTAENGKKIRDLTGSELADLATTNASRAKLYGSLMRKVKGDEVVGEVLTEEDFKSLVDKFDVTELGRLFGK